MITPDSEIVSNDEKPLQTKKSVLGVSLGCLNRWEGLKEWHRKHQHVLQDQGSVLNSKIDTLPPPVINSTPEVSHQGSKHNLSTISEGEEESRLRAYTADFQNEDGNLNLEVAPLVDKLKQLPKLGSKIKRNEETTIKNSEGQGPVKNCKRPFLRRGKGLERYNLRPEDVKAPYKSEDSKPSFKIKSNVSNRNAKLSTKPQLPSGKVSSSKSEVIKSQPKSLPVQKLVLKYPQRALKDAENISETWSQVFQNGSKNEITSQCRENSVDQLLKKSSQHPKCYEKPPEYLSTEKKIIPVPVDEQDSLAAYLDLEQHVGNSSFCSTSSKVDRLISQSSRSSLNPSNPDTISMKQPSPSVSKTSNHSNCDSSRNFRSVERIGIWTPSELENMIRSQRHKHHFRDSSGSVMPDKEEPRLFSIAQNRPDIQNINSKITPCWNASTANGSVKPHLMKTMSGIDLDSSLIRNALSPKDDSHKDLESSETSSSESDFEEEEEEIVVEEKESCNPEYIQSEVPNSKRLSDGYNTVGEINEQIESHLDQLRKEIETLQLADSKSQKHVSGLEKKVKDLEHRLILEARASDRRVNEEREIAAKTLGEERSKFLREKQGLEKVIRDLRRKISEQTSQQDTLKLKQEATQWEEKWRLDRAKARGLESNLRIQVSNLKRENDKLKEDIDKLRREKETEVNAAKAKSACNTRAINTIARQVGKKKLLENRGESDQAKRFSKDTLPPVLTKGAQSSYNLNPAEDKTKAVKFKPVASIGTFPRHSVITHEWSSNEEINAESDSNSEGDVCLGIESTENADECKPVTESFSPKSDGDQLSQSEIEETRMKYEALFGASGKDAPNAHYQTEQRSSPLEQFVETIQHENGCVEQIKRNGTRILTKPDGTWERYCTSGSKMTIPPSGWPICISYFNGDKLEKLEDGSVKYYYAKTKIWQTTYPDGREEVKFPSGQVERRHHDGTFQVVFPNIQDLRAEKNDFENWSYPNGVSVEKDGNGDTIITFANGEREVHTSHFMKKEFLDGSVKFLYKDGSQETRYPSGRIRVKDYQGNLVKDTALS